MSSVFETMMILGKKFKTCLWNSLNSELPFDFILLSNLLYDKEVNEGKESVSFQEIQKTLGISKQSLSRLIRSNEKEGLITKRQAQNDKRIIEISLTDKSKKMIDKRVKEMEEIIDDFLKRFGKEDAEELIKLLNKAINMLSEKEGTTCLN